ncbi:MAG: hypothetical protein EOO70_05535 [Myxococcaceae bacterium]|nr:MAG: hypothetical protein EOO70_05535 [Myxococcaceae bacterium]
MTVIQRSLILSAYAPSLKRNDGRTLTVAPGMERALPGLRLGWTLSDQGKLIPLPQRDEWIAEAIAKERLPLLSNDDEDNLVTVSGWRRPGSSSPGGHPQFEVHAELPLDAGTLASAVDLLEYIADGIHAFWGRVLPSGVAERIAQQFRHRDEEPHLPPLGLPTLKPPGKLSAPELPHHLGWLNYWSAASA